MSPQSCLCLSMDYVETTTFLGMSASLESSLAIPSAGFQTH
jgi:hypothetical protein